MQDPTLDDDPCICCATGSFYTEKSRFSGLNAFGRIFNWRLTLIDALLDAHKLGSRWWELKLSRDAACMLHLHFVSRKTKRDLYKLNFIV